MEQASIVACCTANASSAIDAWVYCGKDQYQNLLPHIVQTSHAIRKNK